MKQQLVQLLSIVTLLFVTVACSISPANNQNLAGHYSDLAGFNIQKGQSPIGFNLPSASGGKLSLADILTDQHVLLVFYRGDWCPYCIDQFSTIQPVLPQLKQYNVKLVAVSPDQQSAAQNTQRKFGQDYTFLMDTDLQVTKQYGINSEEGLPHPAVFLIKQAPTLSESEVAWYYVSTDHTTRPTGEQLLEQVKALISKPSTN
ncbi:peroxiredoxin family protein [Psychrosphaera sp. B3R10]|uniref:peroxiredoxin family protein n=1 Tax=unclassified Psychrosphaera TaxID=2641570 RepID=UPI001C08913B|nr:MULTISPECIES: peroxiredoxin family protein [unclassified Psychrosphaera]MBU2883153.1 peroxiredoxin family protein [Psychrosphaera sp. I2R16]MBU2988609.1 peroxiredoxin family protein [Psychrosphaera sp. B3R10]MDO6719672.1 peroxiredoxin family protein [Psychrosphaera sp. 1_MG-2023]